MSRSPGKPRSRVAQARCSSSAQTVRTLASSWFSRNRKPRDNTAHVAAILRDEFGKAVVIHRAVEPGGRTIAAVIAYCTYIHRHYGRFPAAGGPFRTVLAYQAHHLDPAFYEQFYRPEALTETQRRRVNSAAG